MNADDDCAAAILLAVLLKRRRNRKERKRIWSKEWFKQRPVLGRTMLLKELEFTAENDFKSYVRMSKPTFECLLQKIAHLITKKDTLMRDAIPPHHRLALTLRFLASGKSFEDLKLLTAIAPQTISVIVKETCHAIVSELKDYIMLPKTQNEWIKEASTFDDLWNFPNCIGAIDGKHINIRQPPGSGSLYLNNYKSFSIILMAVVNAKYEFLLVDVGTNGRASDDDVFGESIFFSKLKTNNIPNPKPFSGCSDQMPFVFIADDAFPLSENVLTPFSHNTIKKDEKVFNYRHSRAQSTVKNVFGILASRFRVLLQTINMSPENTTAIVLACCYLHNFLIKQNDCTYFEGGFDSEQVETGAMEFGDWRNDPSLEKLKASTFKNPSNNAKLVREHFLTFFNTVGKVPWQNGIFK